MNRREALAYLKSTNFSITKCGEDEGFNTLDPEILPELATLHMLGYNTIWSCSGQHTEQEDADRCGYKLNDPSHADDIARPYLVIRFDDPIELERARQFFSGYVVTETNVGPSSPWNEGIEFANKYYDEGVWGNDLVFRHYKDRFDRFIPTDKADGKEFWNTVIRTTIKYRGHYPAST